jgi:uncharacterized membrane protein (DUF4010 family)
LSFVGYVARRAVGPERGYPVAGLLGGLISSTAVTLVFARRSAASRALGGALAAGVTAACTVMLLRLAAAAAVLNWPVAAALVPYLAAPFALGTLAAYAGMRRAPEEEAAVAEPQNPLAFWTALQMAALFGVVQLAVAVVRETWGAAGLLVSGAVLGLTDVDALTISMTRSAAAGAPVAVAARALAIGALANTLLKLGLALGLGRAAFRRAAGASLAGLGVAQAASLALLW